MLPKKARISPQELTTWTEAESDDPDYIRWKREKIEAALRHADEYPDDFITEEEIWHRYDLG